MNPIDGGGSNDLMAGGGEDGGGQFPEGTDHCSGDRHHHAHNYPVTRCSRQHAPHFSQTVDVGKACRERARTCDGCYGCCDRQTAETQECNCFGNDICKKEAEYGRLKCRDVCFGHYDADCTSMPR